MIKVLVLVMMLSSAAMAKISTKPTIEGTVAIFYAVNGKSERIVKSFKSGQDLFFSPGDTKIKCKATSFKSMTVSCFSEAGGPRFDMVVDCDTGRDASLQIATDGRSKDLGEIAINASCKTIQEKI